ncbi:MAG: hypothetical protein NTX85_02445 [Candidatus Nomurabacteria bacterium]|nr:hypothetical protein [Candidatus Nomurabacteria bacterium]
MKNFHIFLVSVSFVALVVGFSAYKLANPDRNSVAGQNMTGDSKSLLKDSSSFQNNLVPVPDNSSIGAQSNTSINSENTAPIVKKSVIPARKVYNRESEDEDDD